MPDPCSSLAVKQEPAPPATSTKPALSEEELEKKSKAIIEEYLHINDMKVGEEGGHVPLTCHMLPSLCGSTIGRGSSGAWMWKGGARVGCRAVLTPLFPAGGPAVCAGAGQPLLALHLCAKWHRVHAGEEHHLP